MAAYILTVMQRTTLAAAGLDAADRFGLNPGSLAAFVFIQVAVFSVAQIPAGLLVDRYGPRAMLVANAALLACGQILLAHATTMPVAAAARVLVGTGDAVVFAATLALIPRWFATRRVPVMTQLTTIVGQLGQILSAVPFVALLRHSGWSTAFISVGAASALDRGAGLRGGAQRSARDLGSDPDRFGPRRHRRAQAGVGAAGDTAGILRPHGHAVPDDGVLTAVGPALSHFRSASFGVDRQRAHHGVRPEHSGHRPRDRRADITPSLAPILVDPRHRGGRHRGVDAHPRAARTCSTVAARRARRHVGGRRPRVGGRSGYRADVEPDA